MGLSAAETMLKLFERGGVLAGLVLALCVIAFQYLENKKGVRDLLAEKDAHRATAERLTKVAETYSGIIERLGERRSRAPRQAKSRPDDRGGQAES